MFFCDWPALSLDEFELNPAFCTRKSLSRPLAELCLRGGNITLEDFRNVAPEVFLKLLHQQEWKEVFTTPSLEISKTLGKLAAQQATNSAMNMFRDCERKILQNIFPELSDLFAKTQNQKVVTLTIQICFSQNHYSFKQLQQSISTGQYKKIFCFVNDAIARVSGSALDQATGD